MGMSLSLGLSLSSLRNGVWSPARLLTGASQLAYFDPSDLNTLFQDSAGTTPVTTDGQSVGRILDKSGNGNHLIQSTAGSRPLYGFHPATGVRNLLTYTEDFSNAAWAASGGFVKVSKNSITYAGGVSTPDTNLMQQIISVSGGTASKQFTISAKLSGTGKIRFKNTHGGVIDNFSPDITLTSAPTVYTFTVSNAASAGTGNQIAGFLAASDNSACSLTVSELQLELGSTATAYQKVNTANGVTEANVPTVHFLKFDGTDDFLVSAANLNPGAVDKAQVFAGVRKLSDAAAGIVAETSTSTVVNNGTLYLVAPLNGSGSYYSFLSRGTNAIGAPTTDASFVAPRTNVLTGIGDISGDVVRLRVDGAQVTETLTDQGTGNYLAYPLYIGRRAGASLPFNGNLYSLIVRFSAANLDAAVIDQAEAWTAGKTGVTL